MRRPTETRDTLLETAIDLIWQSNYASVGINEICEKAGTTKGAFYHHFDSKATLFGEAIEHYWEKMKEVLDSIFSPERSSLEQLEGLIEFLLTKQRTESCDENPVRGCPVFTSGAQCGPEEEKVREAAMLMSEKGVRYYAALARNLQSDDLLEGDCDPVQLGEMMYQFAQGLLLYGRVHCDLGVVERNLREGFYRLLELKPECRRAGAGERDRAAPTAQGSASVSPAASRGAIP
jgi:TetR/AcrR family transcriptional repressor of nem operon